MIMIIIIKDEKLKREMESHIIAAQDRAIRTNYVIATIERSQDDPNVECVNKTMRPSATLYVGARNWRKWNTKRGMTV